MKLYLVYVVRSLAHIKSNLLKLLDSNDLESYRCSLFNEGVIK